jgi:hypothetical protein
MWKEIHSAEFEATEAAAKQPSSNTVSYPPSFTHCYVAEVKVKVKFMAEQTTKTQRGSKGMALHFL